MLRVLNPSLCTTQAGGDGELDGDFSAGNQVITVAHLIGRWGIGGLEGQLTQLVNRLPSERFRHVIVFRNGRDVVSPPVRDDVEIVSLDDPARNRRWALRLAKLLRELEVTIVHNRELFTVYDTVAACRMAGVSRLAFSFHGFTDTVATQSVATRWLWRRALRRYGARWAVSVTAREAVVRTLRLPSGTFSVLRNGVDGDCFRPAEGPAPSRQRLGVPMDRVIFLAVGNVTAVKNHQLVLESIRAANLSPESYTLVIVGEDRLGGQTQRWAAANLPEHDIRFVGPTERILDWYHAADVFVLPSRSEGLCNALLEAMACGLPVVATDIPGNREVLRNDETGLLSPLTAPAKFGTTLKRMVEDPGLRKRIGRAAREHVTEEYDINRTVAAYASAYEGLCAHP